MSENIDFSKGLINNYGLLDKCDMRQQNGNPMQYLLFNVLLLYLCYNMQLFGQTMRQPCLDYEDRELSREIARITTSNANMILDM